MDYSIKSSPSKKPEGTASLSSLITLSCLWVIAECSMIITFLLLWWILPISMSWMRRVRLFLGQWPYNFVILLKNCSKFGLVLWALLPTLIWTLWEKLSISCPAWMERSSWCLVWVYWAAAMGRILIFAVKMTMLRAAHARDSFAHLKHVFYISIQTGELLSL